MKAFFWIGFTIAMAACSNKLPNKDGTNQEAPLTGIRVLTYNIHHCNPPSKPDTIDIEAVASVIKKADPDLVALQEVDVGTERSGRNLHQAKELARLTGMHFFFAKAINHQGGEYGNAVLSKFPVMDSSAYLLPTDEHAGGETRSLAKVTVKLPGGQEVIFAGTHLDHQSRQNRSLQVRKIIDILSGESLPVILAGDFNAVPGSPTITSLDQHFTRTCNQNCPGTIPTDNPSKSIDFIAFRPSVSHELKVANHKVGQERYASDHLPVTAELLVYSRPDSAGS